MSVSDNLWKHLQKTSVGESTWSPSRKPVTIFPKVCGHVKRYITWSCFEKTWRTFSKLLVNSLTTQADVFHFQTRGVFDPNTVNLSFSVLLPLEPQKVSHNFIFTFAVVLPSTALVNRLWCVKADTVQKMLQCTSLLRFSEQKLWPLGRSTVPHLIRAARCRCRTANAIFTDILEQMGQNSTDCPGGPLCYCSVIYLQRSLGLRCP